MLELKNITTGYDDKTVLEGIDYRFESGRIYSIIGKNGCGKSTLLKTCIGLNAIRGGEILLGKRKLQEYSYQDRAAKMSYLSQQRNIPDITVERLVMHGRHPHISYPKKIRYEDVRVIEKVMKEMEVLELRDKPLTELSGGECQRAYIAMMLAQDTPVMLFDEPTTYMDIEHQLKFLEQIKKLKTQDKTIIMVMHDLNHAFCYSDEMLLIDNRTIKKSGTPTAMLESGAVEDTFNIKLHMHESGAGSHLVITA